MNIDAIKKRLAVLEEKQQDRKKSFNSDLFWKPTPGSHLIRLLPYKYNPDMPFLELMFHYEVTGRSVISPTCIDPTAPDPILELAAKLRTTSSKEDRQIAYKISPRERFYAPIIVRGQEEKGVQFWSFGPKVFTTLLKTMDDPDYGDITDLKTGRDVVIEYEEKNDKNPFGNTAIRVKPNQSSVITKEAAGTDEGKKVLESIQNMPAVEQIFTIPTYEELSKYLKDYISGASKKEDKTDSDKESLTEKPGKGKPKANEKSAALGTAQKEKISKDFDDLFAL